jgi:5-methylcytosine-specific restriction endonuclease McrA
VRRALLLNSDYSPLHFVSDMDAIILFYKGRAEVIPSPVTGLPSEWDEVFSSPSTSIHVPATMRVLKRVNKKWKPPRFRKKVLFNRDGWKCQYCHTKLVWHNITIDHVLPSSRGGLTSWLNCVTACRPCNRQKDDRTPEEAGMKLLRKPANPSALHFWDAFKADCWHEDWDAFIPREGER